MSESSRADSSTRRKSSRNFGRERLSEKAEGISLRDFRMKSRKEEASKPIYLIRYE